MAEKKKKIEQECPTGYKWDAAKQRCVKIELPKEQGRKVAFVEKEGKQFVVPKREEPELFKAQEEERKKAMEEAAQAEQLKPIPEARKLREPAVGAFEEVKIAPERSAFQKLIGTPLGQAVSGKVALDELKKEGKAEALLNMTDYMIENGLTPQQVSSDLAEQMMLSLELNEKDIEMLKSGETDVSDLAILMEGLPAKGLGVGKYITTIPSERIDALEMKIEKMGNTIRDYRMAAARSPSKRDSYLTLIEKQELKIRDAESRIKLLVIQSPKLQNAPEEVEVTFVVIDRALNRIGDAKNAILGGETINELLAIQQMGVA